MILPLPQQRATIEAHVLRPVPVAPTPALVSSLKLPEGFTLTRWADGLSNPRIVKARPDGTVYVSQRTDANIVMLKDTDRDGIADVQREVASGTDMHGFAFTKDGKTVVIVGIRKLWRADVRPDGTFGPKRELMHDLPDAGQHPNRTVEIGPDGLVYLSIGSTANDAVEHNPYNATMTVCDLDGQNRRILASGLRNTIGYDWQPGTGTLYGWDQGIDWLGDDAQREEVNAILPGRRYGWPFVYEAGKIDQNAHLATEKGYNIERWRAESADPALTYTAHAAGMQIRFLRGSAFPAAYRGDALATMHGSWNRKPPSGYELVRIRFENGKPQGVEPFLTGFLQDPTGEAREFGRPCGLAELPDGSILFSDDAHGALYRIAYGPQRAAMQAFDTSKTAPELVSGPGGLSVRLGAFGEANSEYAPRRAQSPSLAVSTFPKGTVSMAVIMEDPDASSVKPTVHWLMADLSPTRTILPSVQVGDRPTFSVKDVPQAWLAQIERNSKRKGELVAVAFTASYGGVHGGTSNGRVGYYGPKPPVGDPPHRYQFTVYVLDRKLGMKPGFTRLALLKAMRGHVLAQGTAIGKYGK